MDLMSGDSGINPVVERHYLVQSLLSCRASLLFE